jgi:hypothetical protein
MGKEDLKKLPDKLTDSEKKKIKNENKAKVVCRPLCTRSVHWREFACNAQAAAVRLFAGILVTSRPCLATVHQITSLICVHAHELHEREERNVCGMKNQN